MISIDGFDFGAKCVGCTTETFLWARDHGGFWHCIPIARLKQEIVSGSVIEPENLAKSLREVLGKMGGVLCPNCMPQILAHIAEIKELQNKGEYAQWYTNLQMQQDGMFRLLKN